MGNLLQRLSGARILIISLGMIVLLLLSLQLYSAESIQAAACGDVGSNIAGNYDYDNLLLISEESNCDGLIPVTVIITNDMINQPSATDANVLQELVNDLEELGFNPTYRPWGFPDSADLPDWNATFAQLPPNSRVQFFNERNLCTQECSGSTANPAADARIADQLMTANPNISWGTMPLSTLNPTDGVNMQWQEYWRGFSGECPKCMGQFDFVAVNTYVSTQYQGEPSITEFINHTQEQIQFLRSLGVQPGLPVVISEAGIAGGAYQGNFQQRVADTKRFAQELETYLTEHPEIDFNLEGISFLMMNDATDQQYMIHRVCDAAGVCTWEVENYEVLNTNIEAIQPLQMGELYQCSVNGSTPESGEFRPSPCENCRLTVPEPVNSCTLSSVVKKETEDITCEDLDHCGGQAIYKETWGFIWELDTSDTNVPFADYHKTIKEETEVGMRSKSLNNYINAYFAGTSIYDGDEIDDNDLQQIRNIAWEAGVARKLLPSEEQDRMRIKLIEDGLDYKVKQAGMSMQDWNGGRISSINRQGRMPPLRSDPDYKNLRKQWEGTDYGRFWTYLPLFSREDAPGKAILRIQNNPGSLSPISGGKNTNGYTVEVPLSIPHLTRMYEVTKKLNEFLTPEIKEAQVRNGTVIDTLKPQECSSIFGIGLITALGCIPTGAGLAAWVLYNAVILGGGIAFMVMSIGAFIFITSGGEAEKIQNARQIIIAAVSGLIIIVFAILIMRLIFTDVINIPGFSQANEQDGEIVIKQNSNVQLTTSTEASIGSSTDSLKIRDDRVCKDVPAPNVTVKRITATADTATDVKIVDSELLAQGGSSGGEYEGGCGLVIEKDGFVKYYNNVRDPSDPNYCGIIADYALTVEYSVDGGAFQVGCTTPIAGGELLPLRSDGSVWPRNISDNDLGSGGHCGTVGGVSVTQAASSSFGVRVTTSGGKGDCQKAITREANVVKDANGNWIAQGCGQVDTPPPPPPAPTCGNATPGISQCNEDGLKDENPNDEVCCSTGVEATVENYVSSISQSEEKHLCECIDDDDDGDCDGKVITKMQQREIEDKLKLPYLKKAWEYAAGMDGFYQIFRPPQFEIFPDDAAKTNMKYKITGTKGEQPTVGNPLEGEFYFPYLGGLHMTKKCISEVFLTPLELQGDVDWCDFSNSRSNPFEEAVDDPDVEHTRANDTLPDEVDENNCSNLDQNFAENVSVTDTAQTFKNGVEEETINKFANQYNLSEEEANDLKVNWNSVVNRARTGGLNPVLAVTIWIEESHMGLYPRASAQFGCLDGNSQSNLNSNLSCVLNFSYKHPEFQDFMEAYSGDSENKFCNNANFPVNVTYWYKKLGR